MSEKYDNTGKASSWPPRKQGAPRRIVCFAHRDIRAGEEFEIALWENASANPKAPDYTGKVQDKYVPPQRSSQPAPKTDFDDSIPF